ncbi:solute carrier family 49 member 4-like [Littorina saxatilis]|uniref:solute carrier family 49 member 4-like n=1 Tax=Littorina saxatilis TaxID=31220 RepID=UPI0038B4D8EF
MLPDYNNTADLPITHNQVAPTDDEVTTSKAVPGSRSASDDPFQADSCGAQSADLPPDSDTEPARSSDCQARGERRDGMAYLEWLLSTRSSATIPDGITRHVTFKSSATSIILPELSVGYSAEKRRWYVLVLYCLYACGQSTVTNTFGPLSITASVVYGWEEQTVLLLNFMGPLAFLLSGGFFCWIVTHKGLRVACVSSSCLVAIGTFLQCIPDVTPDATRLVLTGHFVNGLGGPLAMSGAPALSACWFPPNQRAMATTVGAMAFYLGLAVSSRLGPYLVPTPGGQVTPSSLPPVVNSSGKSRHNDSLSIQTYGSGREILRDGLHVIRGPAVDSTTYVTGHAVRVAEAAWTTTVFVLMVVYFPAQPTLPPSPSAAAERKCSLRTFKDLCL